MSICKKTKKGFVSIFAIFFSAIVISVLTAIYVLLLKQIETMQIDAQSFQSLYVADSALECMILKEQTATYADSVFLPENAGNLGNCGEAGDLEWVTEPTPQPKVAKSIRAKSVANFKMITDQGDFCTIISTDVETATDVQWWVTPPSPNFMTIAGHNKACGSPSQKVVERVVDFYF